MHYLTLNLPRMIVLDPKGSPSIGLDTWDLEEPNSKNIAAFLRGSEVRLRIREPEPDNWEKWFDLVWKAENCVVYIDEINGIIPPGAKPPFRINQIWTQGREKGIGGWACTQRPSWIPLFFMSEADWYFIFSLRNRDDRKRVSGYVGDEVIEPIQDPHGFWYEHVSWKRPQYITRFQAPRERKQ